MKKNVIVITQIKTETITSLGGDIPVFSHPNGELTVDGADKYVKGSQAFNPSEEAPKVIYLEYRTVCRIGQPDIHYAWHPDVSKALALPLEIIDTQAEQFIKQQSKINEWKTKAIKMQELAQETYDFYANLTWFDRLIFLFTGYRCNEDK